MHCCSDMVSAVENPDVPIVYLAHFREYGVRVLYGGTAFIVLRFCPWCGRQLPASLRDEWFDELERRAIDPAGDDVPAEFLDERWYRNS